MESYNIQAEENKFSMEIVVRAPEEAGKKRKCEIFGDLIKGLKIKDLEKTLDENPTQRFLP